MFPASLPFDYLRHFAGQDRIRRKPSQPREDRVRRPEPKEA
jgi:hypothetical protein